MKRRLVFQSLFFVLGILSLFGCGDPRGPRGEVSGNIVYEGKPLPTGTIIFHVNDGRTDSGTIKDGKYIVYAAIAGPNKISVTTPKSDPSSEKSTLKPLPGMPGAPESAASIEIPQRYADEKTSELSLDVKVGKNSLDIELKK